MTRKPHGEMIQGIALWIIGTIDESRLRNQVVAKENIDGEAARILKDHKGNQKLMSLLNELCDAPATHASALREALRFIRNAMCAFPKDAIRSALDRYALRPKAEALPGGRGRTGSYSPRFLEPATGRG